MRAIRPKPKPQRRLPLPSLELRWTWRGKLALAALVMALAGAAGFAALRSGVLAGGGNKYDMALRQVLRDAGFTVRSVTVAGRVQTDAKELLGVLNIAKGDSILHIDLDAAHSRIAHLPWVREARITRSLPDAVHIELTERQPIAIWQRNGKMVLVDDSGVEITEKDVAEYPDLPLIVGKGAPKAAGELIALLASESQLQNRVAAAVRVSERRWNIRLKDGIDIRLPELDPLAAWRKLARYEASNGLLGRDVELVDLRLANRVVVRLTQGAVRRVKGPEREARSYGFYFKRGSA